MDVQQREHWNGEAAFLGDAWVLRKGNRAATCALFAHQFGWELRLTIGKLLRTQVCRSTDDVHRRQEEWRAAALLRGYTLGARCVHRPQRHPYWP
jgi:hypothetical protein